MAITVESGFWSDIGSGGYSQLPGKAPSRKRLSRVINKRGMKKLQELMLTLNGATAGSAASATYKRVQHADSDGLAGQIGGGGKVNVETVTVVSRNTTATDKSDIDTLLTTEGQHKIATYVADKSGNGGGGKLAHVQS